MRKKTNVCVNYITFGKVWHPYNMPVNEY